MNAQLKASNDGCEYKMTLDLLPGWKFIQEWH